MPRHQVYATRADKQAAYRQRAKGLAVTVPTLPDRPRLTPAEKQRRWRVKQAAWGTKHSPKAYHSTKTTEWSTPQSFYDALDTEFHFTLDVCATTTNAKCPRSFTLADDGLQQDWGREICWMNPPYGKTIALWIRKAAESALAGAVVVCLVPVRTDTRWWQRYVLGAEVRFVPGRLTFGGAVNPAPFPNAVVVFRPLALLSSHRERSGGE